MIERVAFNGQRVNLVSDFDLDSSRLNTLSRTVTGMELVDSPDVGDVEVPRVEYTPSSSLSIEYDDTNKVISVKGPVSRFSRGEALLYVAEYLATCLQSSEKGTFLTHAAATYNKDSDASTILFGEKGAGKTTIALRICVEGGMQLIGNDQVYIGATAENVTTEGGNQWFNVRETAIKSDDFLSGLLAEKSRDESKPSWNDKIRMDLTGLGVAGKDGVARVENIYHLRLDATQDELYVHPWEGVQRNLILHEKIGRHILSQATPFQDDNGEYLGSLPLIEIEQSMSNRDRLVRSIIKAGVMEVFAPNSEVAVNYILNRGSE